MSPLNSNHLDCLRTALELLDHCLKQNSLALTALKPAGSDALSSAQIAKPIIPAVIQPIPVVANDVLVDQPALAVETSVATNALAQQASLANFGALPLQVPSAAPISSELTQVYEKPELLQLAGRGFFQSLPWLVAHKATSAEEKLPAEPSPDRLSDSFFKGVVWDKASTVALQTSPQVSTELTLLTEIAELRVGQSYFQSLPWAAATDPDKASGTQIQAEGLVPIQQAGSFFMGIAWQKPTVPIAPTVQTVSVPDIENLHVSNGQAQKFLDSSAYFKEIPWRNTLASNKQQAKPDTDRSWMAELATQSALRTAARTSGRNQDQEDCQTYFKRVLLSVPMEKTQQAVQKK
jgi:hypothetical protein